jgi:proliferating cell nuclear antigen|tara:strand:- start:1869 stop:2624 length:756 start_codon:yes stop_codon:yes gene_type:complete
MEMLRVTAKQQLMREIVDLLSVLTDEAKLCWGENGLSTTVVDGSHVALMSVTIADACFETYEVEPVEIGLELGKLRELLTLAGPNDLVEIDYDGATGAINVRVGEVHRILRGLDTGSMAEPRMPELKFDCRAKLSAERLSRALRAAKFVGELVDLSLDKNQMTVSVTVEAGEAVNVRFDAGEMSELIAPKPTQSTYSLQFLEPLSRKLASGLTDEVSIEFQDRYPLRLTWSSNDGGAAWSYFLAPRVSNEP